MKALFSILFALGIYTGVSSQTYLPLTGGTLTGGLTGTSATFTGNIYSNYGSSSQIAFTAPGVNYAAIADKDLFRRIWFETTGGYRTLLDIPANGSLQMRNSSGGILSTFLENGNIGVGIANPSAKLHIGQSNPEIRFDYNGTDNYYGSLRWAAMQLGNNGQNRIIAGRSAAGGLLDFYVNNTNDAANYSTVPDGTLAMRINFNGNVGIGTASPSEKLSVNGKIRAKEIKVESVNWPDYVFHKDYPLKPLSEVEKFIQTNHHLPEMPDAAEIEKEGLSLGEMNSRLLQKIEELTLYLIDKDKQVSDLQNRLKRLEDKQ